MCQPSLRAKFRTCAGDEPLSYPRWELWRSEPEQEEMGLRMVGSFLPPSLDHEFLVDRVLQDLNRPDAFDTDLGFRSGDKLVLHWHEDDSIEFRYEGQEWGKSWGQALGNGVRTGHWQRVGWRDVGAESLADA